MKLIDEWLKNIWYTHTGLLLSHKKNKILSFPITWIDLQGILLSEMDKEGQIPHDFIYIWNLEN